MDGGAWGATVHRVAKSQIRQVYGIGTKFIYLIHDSRLIPSLRMLGLAGLFF